MLKMAKISENLMQIKIKFQQKQRKTIDSPLPQPKQMQKLLKTW